MSEENRGQPPLQTFRDGAVVVKLWRQESPENGPFVSATIGRTYMDAATNEYRESRSLSGTDMLKAQALLGEAHREAVKWRQFFREEERRQAPDRDTPDRVDNAATEPQRELQRAEGLVAQRDAVLANAEQPQRNPAREKARER